MNTRRGVLPVFAAALLLGGCAPQTGPLRPIAAPAPTEGTVVYVSGGVQVSRDGSWIDVEPGDAVGAGATIRTDADGYCELLFGDAVSVRVEPDTQFRCDSIAVGATAAVSGGLTAGAILAKVKRLGGSNLQVSTPSAVVGVRGTAFMVNVTGTTTTVTVREGSVSLTREGTTVDVEAGRRAEAAPGEPVATEPAAVEDLEAIDAFEPSVVEMSDIGKLVKVIVVVEQADAEIWLGSTIVGRGSWGAVVEEGKDVTLVLKRTGYEDAVVFVPKKGGRPVRIARGLKPLAATTGPAEPSGTGPSSEPATVPEAPAETGPTTGPAPSTGQPAPSAAGPSQPAPSVVAPAQPAAAAPAPTPPAAEEPPETRAVESRMVESQPAVREELAPLNGLAFRVDPSIGNDPFFRWAAERFARQVPGFELVAEPGSASLDAPAWPRGVDIVGGLHNSTAFTYERLPQLVAAKLVRPLDGWFDTAQLAPVLVDAVRVGGKVYGVPVGGRTPILYYNKDLVRDAPRRWADITALAAEYAQKGGDALVLPSLEPFLMGMFPESRGIRLLVPDAVKTELGSAKAAAVYNDMRTALVETAMSIGLPQDDAVAMFRARRAALLIDGPWSFESLSRALGASLGVATLPSWGAPARELTPYANVLALFVSTGVTEERAVALRRFSTFLLEEESQVELAVIRLKTGDPIAPALRALDAPAARLVQQEQIISTLHRQLETAVPMPRGPLAADAWKVFREVLEGIRRQEGGEMLAQMADTRFVLYGLERRTVPDGARELRAVIDPAEKSQGLFFRPFDEESDLRLISIGDSRGVVSVNNRGLRSDRGELSFVYLVVNHDPYRAGRAPVLRGRIEYFDEPNATLRVVYDSKDRTVREYPDEPDTWGAWKEAIVIPCAGTRTWKTAEFPVPDARFDRRCNGADFRIEVSAKGKIPAIRSVILTPAK